MKIGRDAHFSHVKVNGHTYIMIDVPYTDCGHASDSRYSNKHCHCDACMDAHANAARRRDAAYRARRRRQKTTGEGHLPAA